MATIRRPGGLFVATTAICVVLMSAMTFVEAESLRGGRRSLIVSEKKSYYAQEIADTRRRLDEGGEDGGGEDQDEEKEEEQEQQYQEGNNEEQGEQQEQNNEEEGQQVEEMEDNNEENADDDGSNFVQDTFSNAMDRFDEDVEYIWSTSPSQWNNELWIVFAAVAGSFTLLLSCFFYMLCVGCSRNDVVVGTADDIKKRRQLRKHRGRLSSRMRNNDNDTVATEADDKAFTLITDVENNGTMEDKSRLGPTSVYAHTENASHDCISPMSSKTGRLELQRFAGDSSRAPINDAETQYTRSSMKTRNTSKHGIFNETVDVWSEFLGLKKSKSYNTAAFFKRRETEEADDIDETDDEYTRRSKPRSSSSRNSSISQGSSSMARRLETGTYVAPRDEGIEHPITPMVPKPMVVAEPGSPRRTALVKTRKLLKSIGKSKVNRIGNSTSITSTDSKEKALSTKGSNNSSHIS